MAFLAGVFFPIVAIADETAGSRIADAIPAQGFGGFMEAFSGTPAVDDNLVAALHDEYVFHGFTAADSYQINYRSPDQSCKK
jgi:hypothetical protein